MSTQKNGKLLQGKDLISIGIFSAIYFVLNFICMLLSGLHPVIWILILLGTFLAACLLGELIRFLGGYKSFLWNAAAFVGAWIANGMFHKHFKKAGMV